MEQEQICRLLLRNCWQLSHKKSLDADNWTLLDKITENAVRFKHLNRVVLLAQVDQRTDTERSQCSVITLVSSWELVMVRYYVIAAHLWAFNTRQQETLQILPCPLRILELLTCFFSSRNLKKKKKNLLFSLTSLGHIFLFLLLSMSGRQRGKFTSSRHLCGWCSVPFNSNMSVKYPSSNGKRNRL